MERDKKHFSSELLGGLWDISGKSIWEGKAFGGGYTKKGEQFRIRGKGVGLRIVSYLSAFCNANSPYFFKLKAHIKLCLINSQIELNK